MSQSERVIQASMIKIGGSEDEAKEAVKQLFKKSTTPKYSNSTTKELNAKYEADLNRLAYLLDCDFDGTLKINEELELSMLEKEFKGVDIPALSDLIYQSPTFKTTKEITYYTILASDLKMFEDFKTTSEAVLKSNKEFIISIREELQALRDTYYNKFYSLDCEDLF